MRCTACGTLYTRTVFKCQVCGARFSLPKTLGQDEFERLMRDQQRNRSPEEEAQYARQAREAGVAYYGTPGSRHNVPGGRRR